MGIVHLDSSVAVRMTHKRHRESAQSREKVNDLVATQGIAIPDRSLPYGLTRVVAAVGETVWRLLSLKGQPPVDYLSVLISGQECTIDTGKAVCELGYHHLQSGWAYGDAARRADQLLTGSARPENTHASNIKTSIR